MMVENLLPFSEEMKLSTSGPFESMGSPMQGTKPDSFFSIKQHCKNGRLRV